MNTLKTLVLVLVLPALAFAGSSFRLDVFTDNGEFASSTGLVYTISVESLGQGQIGLTVFNDSSVYSVIEAVYFEDMAQIISRDTLSLSEDDVVQFSIDRKPGTLPSGQNLSPDFNTTLSVSADPPPALTGITPGERLDMVLQYSGDYDTFVSDIASGQIRIGAHIIAFPDGSSESATVRVVPEADTAILFLVGLASVWYTRKAKADYEKNKS